MTMALIPVATALDSSLAPSELDEEVVEPIHSSVQRFTIDMDQIEDLIDDNQTPILPLSVAVGIGLPLERMTDFLLNGTAVYDENDTLVETRHFEHFRHREPGVTAVFGWSGQSLTGYIQVCNAVFDFIPVGTVAGQVEVHARTQGGFQCPTDAVIEKLEAGPCILPYTTCNVGENLDEMDSEAIAAAALEQIPSSVPVVLGPVCNLHRIIQDLCESIVINCITPLQPGCEPGGGGQGRSPTETRGARDAGDQLPAPVNGQIKVHYWTDNDFRAASNDPSLLVSTAYAAQAQYMDEYLGITLDTLTEHTFNVNGNWAHACKKDEATPDAMTYFATQLGTPAAGTAIHAFYSGEKLANIGCAKTNGPGGIGGTDGEGRDENDRPIVVSTAEFSDSNGRYYWGLSPRDLGLLTAHESAHVWGQTKDFPIYSDCGGTWVWDDTVTLMCNNPSHFLKKDFWAWFGGTTSGQPGQYKFRTIDFVVDGFSEIPH